MKDKTLAELRSMAEAMRDTVLLINTFSAYIETEDNSPAEDQTEKALEVLTAKIIGRDGGEGVIMSLLSIMLDASDPDRVQAFLDRAAEDLQQEVRRVRGY